jgi:hydrogenase maturation protease
MIHLVPPVLLVGIGNDYRSDDSAGLVAIRLLKARYLPGTLCIENNGDGTALLEIWAQANRAILIDAVSSGASPGTIHHLDALALLQPSRFSFSSTHAFGLVEAIQLAYALKQLPASLTIFGIEGENFTAGTMLSPEVEKAVYQVVLLIAQEVS